MKKDKPRTCTEVSGAWPEVLRVYQYINHMEYHINKRPKQIEERVLKMGRMKIVCPLASVAGTRAINDA